MANRALLVGINRFSVSKHDLRGCVNDMMSLRDLLIGSYEFTPADITMLVDADATRAAILGALRTLVRDVRDGDRIVFGAATHGTQKGFGVPGEEDGKNEALVPHDVSYSTLIVDDELFDIIAPAVDGKRASFTAIYDLCHSGTMVRTLDFDKDDGQLVEPVVNRCIDVSSLREVTLRDVQLGPYNVLSACRDEETAADLRDAGGSGRPRGAFSYALHRRLAAMPHATLAQLEVPVLDGIRAVSSHTQTPQYYAVDPALPFLALP
jgi:hypothetical protein